MYIKMKIQRNTDVILNIDNVYSVNKNASIPSNKITTADSDGLPEVIYEKSGEIESEYPTYNANGTVNGINATSSTWSNQNIQTALINLGFYSGPANGNLNSDLMRIAIGNFQTVYGLNKTGAMNQTTLSKLQLVDGFRNRAMNILAENENNVITHHDPDYVYDVNDEKGYGIMQWTFWSRKQGLLNQAKSMGLQPKDLNAQLAYFRTEMNTLYKIQWNEFKSKTTLADSTDYFLKELESPKDNNSEERIGFANEIYQLMYKL